VTVTTEKSLDLVRRYARVDLDGVRLPTASVMSPAGSAEAAVNRQIQIAVALQSAEVVRRAGQHQAGRDRRRDTGFARCCGRSLGWTRGVVPSGVDRAGEGPGLDYGVSFLMRQAGSLGGGSTEMSRNIISERVLGMPREFAADRDVPFSQVRQGR